MASLVCEMFRFPEQAKAMQTAIQTVDDTKFLALVISAPDSNGKQTAFFVHKT